MSESRAARVKRRRQEEREREHPLVPAHRLEMFRQHPLLAIQDEYVVCLICGRTYTTLNVHVSRAHSMTLAEYRKEFGYPCLTRLCTDSYREIGKRRTPELQALLLVAQEAHRAKSPFCTQPGCGRSHLANGLCSMHESRRRKGQPLNEPVKRKRKPRGTA